MTNTRLEKFLIFSFTAFFFLAMATACTPAEIEGSLQVDATPISEPVADTVNPLIETNWNLDGIDGQRYDGKATLGFSADTMSGLDGCNHFGGNYSLVDGAIVIDQDQFMRTEMACKESVMEAADRYMQALLTASAFRLYGDSLAIETEFGELVFVKPVSAEFTNTIWQLNGLAAGDGAMLHMAIDESVILQVDNQGGVGGSGGCNSFGGSVSIDGKQLNFGDLNSTLMACADEVMQRESEFMAALRTVTRYEILRDNLSLFNSSDKLVVSFVNVDSLEVEGMIKTFFVGAEQVDCVGVAPMKCLLVKENADDEYTYFYDSIAGFEWEAGFEYELLVAVSEVENPPADASSLSYELIELVAKVPVDMTAGDDAADGLENSSWQLLHSIVGGDAIVPPPAESDIFINFGEGDVSGNAGCNSFKGMATVDGNALTFGPLATTRMACGETLDLVERGFLGMLEGVTNFSMENGRLTLLNQDLPLAVFVVK